MTQSIQDLLQSKNYHEPPEVNIIKTFLSEHYQASCQITVQSTQIVIAVQGAALAGALRMRLHELKVLCNTDKRLVLRIIS